MKERKKEKNDFLDGIKTDTHEKKFSLEFMLPNWTAQTRGESLTAFRITDVRYCFTGLLPRLPACTCAYVVCELSVCMFWVCET